MIAILSALGPYIGAALAALAALVGAFFFGHSKGTAAEKKNTDLVKAQADAAQAQNAAADAKADAAANRAVIDARDDRAQIDQQAATRTEEATKTELNQWSRD